MGVQGRGNIWVEILLKYITCKQRKNFFILIAKGHGEGFAQITGTEQNLKLLRCFPGCGSAVIVKTNWDIYVIMMVTFGILALGYLICWHHLIA